MGSIGRVGRGGRKAVAGVLLWSWGRDGALDLGRRGKKGSTGSLPEFLAGLACGLAEGACSFGGLE